jgi:Flp pilus assembly protein TadG
MIVIDWFYTIHAVKKWANDQEGVAALEAAMLFPPMLSLLFGTFDLGNGIMISQKTITSSQVAADLVSRNRTVDSAGITDIVAGAKLAFEPYAPNGFGIDVVSVEFDASQNPVVLWRHTEDMLPNSEAVSSVVGMADEGEGMIIVTVRYKYTPQFAQYFMDAIDFSEVAYTRGRRSATVTWEG